MAYKSKYEEQLANALNNLTNREKFSYDFNADPMYQQYKDQYTKLGNEAAANAAANVSALTGGYGNSYAATAAAQANQQYLTKLNEMIPSLQQQALNKYMMEGDELNNVYSTLSDADSRDYSKYRDEVADQQWQQNFEEQIRQYNQDFAENKRRYDQEWTASQAAQAAAQALLNSQQNSGGTIVKVIGNNGGETTSTTKTATSTPKASVTVGTTGSTAASGNNIKSASPMLYDGTTTQTVKKATDTQNLEATATKNKAKANLEAYNTLVNNGATIYKNSHNNEAINGVIAQALTNGVIKESEAQKMKDEILKKAK